MEKQIVRIVLTGGPSAGKTTLTSHVMKLFTEDGWRVITIPETASELISQFHIKPFDNCMSMLAFQDFVIADQLHKEKLALDAAQIVPEEKILIIYDRAVMDDKAYISDEDFVATLAKFGLTEAEILTHYDLVLHLVTCAKGAEFAYSYNNKARTETLEEARDLDDRTLRAWSSHPNLKIIDNSVNFADKIKRALQEIFRVVGEPEPMPRKKKYLIALPDMEQLAASYNTAALDMMQTYLRETKPGVERRVRQQRNGTEYLYFYTEKHLMKDGTKWDTEKTISQKDYIQYLMEGDPALHQVHKIKYRFTYRDQRFEIDVYPFCEDKAIMFRYAESDSVELPPEITVLRDVSDDPDYKNRQLAISQRL
ncbi:MAG: AAA family ATPase [Oscillospiraceae bacterium]|nr:AAA family ATPase [Oscillospiraceae bacterium]